ncbi:MAG: hypothetical protein P1U41_08300 [Vicingaceae bacterium]|nr:hypothetical protein [Vicingaceae bacterium]
MKHLVWIFSILLFACSEEINSTQEKILIDNSIIKDTIDIEQKNIVSIADSTPKQGLKNSEDNEFLSFYQSFTNAIDQTDLDATNQCIDPNGLYIIETNGAMPLIQKVFEIKAYSTKSIRTTFFNLGFQDIKDQPIFEALPKVICGGEIYDKYGCYAAKTNPLKESGAWNYSDLNEKEIQAIEYAVQNINITVRNTQNFTYYFSKTEQGWRLTFIDIRTPCQA